MTNLTDEEVYELRRVLLSFKENLPPHELGYWRIVLRYEKGVVVEYEKAPDISYQDEREGVRIEGRASCTRCRKQFDIPRIGNFFTYSDHVEATIAKAKEWVAGIAERDSPCWGGVPKPDDRKSYAVYD